MVLVVLAVLPRLSVTVAVNIIEPLVFNGDIVNVFVVDVVPHPLIFTLVIVEP